MTSPDPKNFRVSDAEREHVLGVLQKATGQGLISLEEFTERADTVVAAKTRAELNQVLLDLPGLVHTETERRTVPPMERAELKTTMSSTERKGNWVVPRELVLRSRMGSTELDFTEATINHRVVRIELDVTAGSVEMLLPDNATAETSVDAIAGSVEDKTRGGQGGGTHFIITGTVRAGSVEIRNPRYFHLGRLTIRFPWKLIWRSD